MKLKHTKVANLAATLIAFGSLAGGANGTIVLTFSAPSSTSTIVTVSGSGSAVLTATSGVWNDTSIFGGVTFRGITFFNVSGNPLNGNLNGDPEFATITSDLQASNGVSSITVDLMQLDDDGSGSGSDELGLRFSSAPSFMIGETITFSGSATFDVSSAGATFADFNIGSYSPLTTARWANNFALSDFSNGIVITDAIPEPSSALLLGFGALGLAARRYRIS
ncbi:PEP-CTERM sorting domain-containing protein [Akkermansiaceae bacterium]|nr:PEP-CTERM sorting domain-containing protein [Akkermansiaceae bacterium]